MKNELKVDLDVTALDEVIEKANQLKATLEEVVRLINSLKVEKKPNNWF